MKHGNKPALLPVRSRMRSAATKYVFSRLARDQSRALDLLKAQASKARIVVVRHDGSEQEVDILQIPSSGCRGCSCSKCGSGPGLSPSFSRFFGSQERDWGIGWIEERTARLMEAESYAESANLLVAPLRDLYTAEAKGLTIVAHYPDGKSTQYNLSPWHVRVWNSAMAFVRQAAALLA